MLKFIGIQESCNRLWWAGRAFIILLIALFALVYGIKWLGFRLNETDSMPKGIYHFTLLSPSNDQLKDNNTVLITQDTNNPMYMLGVQRGYDPYGVDLIKKVIGVQGDHVSVDGNTVKVCQNESGHCYELPCLTQDAQGHDLHCTDFQGVIPKGKVFVYGESSKLSFDSRYFGLIDTKYIQGVGSLWWNW